VFALFHNQLFCDQFLMRFRKKQIHNIFILAGNPIGLYILSGIIFTFISNTKLPLPGNEQKKNVL